MSSRQVTILVMSVLLGVGCRFSSPDPAKDDLPTQGKVMILADADCRAVVERELDIFHAFYRKADITVRFLGEGELLKAMMNDSVRCVITAVAPGAEQDAYLRGRNITAPIVPLYRSAIALVTHPASTLKSLDLDQIAQILGRGEAAGLDTLQAVFAGQGSGLARMLRDSLGIEQLRAQALEDVPAVVELVSRNPRAIGFLPFEALSDLDDPEVRSLREKVRLVPLAPAPGALPVPLNQSTVADSSYPLPRTVHAIVTEGKSGLGTGFVSFVANHKGQKVILKLGIVPITIPERIIEIVYN